MEIYYFIAFVIILAAFFVFIHLQIRSLAKSIKSISFDATINKGTPDEGVDERELSIYEKQRLQRDLEFDERINKLKDELARRTTRIHQGTIAEELHPNVHNLPHNIIPNYESLPDVEVAE